MLLYIVRHGQPIYGPDTLTELGRKQAEALADRFAIHGLDRIFSSPMGRARETAQPTADRLGLPVRIEHWTREIWPELTLTMPDGSPHFCMDLYPDTYRSAENKTLGEYWHTMPCLNSIAGKQAWARVVRYSDNFFMRLGYKRETDGVYRIVKPNDERVALFCHAGFSLTWLPHLLCIPPHLFWAAFDITHTGVTLLEFKNNESGVCTPKCLMLSDMSHILNSGLNYEYNSELPV